MAVLDPDHELAEVLSADVERDEAPLVQKVEQLAPLAELENQHVRLLKSHEKNRAKKDEEVRPQNQRLSGAPQGKSAHPTNRFVDDEKG